MIAFKNKPQLTYFAEAHNELLSQYIFSLSVLMTAVGEWHSALDPPELHSL